MTVQLGLIAYSVQHETAMPCDVQCIRDAAEEIARLRKALEPFALAAEAFADAEAGDEVRLRLAGTPNDQAGPAAKVEDLRLASEILADERRS